MEKVEKAPDTAKFSFTIQDEEKDTASAQAVVSKKIDQVKSDLVAAGVDTQDITTDTYNSILIINKESWNASKPHVQ